MEQETVKLLNVLRRIARAAGYAAWTKPRPGGDSVLRWTIQSRSRETRRTRAVTQTIVHSIEGECLTGRNSNRCARVAGLL